MVKARAYRTEINTPWENRLKLMPPTGSREGEQAKSWRRGGKCTGNVTPEDESLPRRGVGEKRGADDDNGGVFFRRSWTNK